MSNPEAYDDLDADAAAMSNLEAYDAAMSELEAYGGAVEKKAHAPGTSASALIENRTFDELEVGDTDTLERSLTWRDIELFAVVSGDVNPAHVDADYARSDMFHGIVAHGMLGASLISTVLGTRLPGPGAIYLEQTLSFRHPVSVGDTITVSVTVADKQPEGHRVVLDCRCVNQRGETVIEGTAQVIAPTEKIRRHRFTLPDVSLLEHGAGA